MNGTLQTRDVLLEKLSLITGEEIHQEVMADAIRKATQHCSEGSVHLQLGKFTLSSEMNSLREKVTTHV